MNNSDLDYIDEVQLKIEDTERVILYLENPVSTGLWRLRAEWISKGGISDYLFSEIEKNIDDKGVLTIRGVRITRLRLTDMSMERMRTGIYDRPIFLFEMFSYLVKKDSCQNGEDIDDIFSPTVLRVVNAVGASNIIEKYADAFDYFKNNIWHEDFSHSKRVGDLMNLKEGYFLVENPRGTFGNNVEAISWHRLPLSNYLEFLKLLGKVGRSGLMPVFSPEEEVFEPYFSLLNVVYRPLIEQNHLLPLLEKAIENFFEENYMDCVGKIGLLAEDILTQIYETLYREQLTKGLTLGQLADEIDKKAIIQFKKKETPPPDLAVIYPEIKTLLERELSDNKESITLMRQMLVTVIESFKHANERIDRCGRIEKKQSLFPDRVGHSVNELIRYRNAASHKSRVPIGPAECRRAAHSLVVLVRWWILEKSIINWDDTPKDILRSCVDRSS